ncbi:MAG: hypothetical protein HQ483_18345 [Rhodospirillales bacterium]|nr:hypothetical protein [Rhodospirillales bacterium]
MQSLSNWFKPGERRSAEAEQKLRRAYQAVFLGKPSKQDQEVVLSDLLSFGDLFSVALPDEDLRLREGRRQLAYRLFRFLELAEAERRATAVAAITETLVSDAEGAI